MNVADSEQMAQLLAPEYELTSRAEEADLYLINTCAIRRKAEEKVKSLLGSLKFLKARRPHLVIGVGGCVAQQEGERLLAAAPHLNLVFGTQAAPPPAGPGPPRRPGPAPGRSGPEARL